MQKVEIKNNYIIFKSDESEKRNYLYKTGTIDDPKLVDRLHQQNVKFTKVIPRGNSPFLTLFCAWILPLVIFIAIGQWFDEKNARRR